MRKFFLFLISLLIGVLLFGYVIKSVGWTEIKNVLFLFRGWEGVLIFLLTFFFLIVGVLKWKEILRSQNSLLSFSSLFYPYLSGFSLMYLFQNIGFGGELLRGYTLKKIHSLSFTKGMASVIIDRILDWTVQLIIVFFGVLIFIFKIGFPPQHLAVVLGIAFLIFFIGICLFYYKILKGESFFKFFLNFFSPKYKKDISPFPVESEISLFFKKRDRFFWKSLFFSFLRSFILFWRCWFLIYFLGSKINFSSAFSILGFHYLATSIPIPVELGITEIVQVFVFSALGLNRARATAFVMIVRGVNLLFALLGLLLSLRLGIAIIKENLFKNKKNFNEKK